MAMDDGGPRIAQDDGRSSPCCCQITTSHEKQTKISRSERRNREKAANRARHRLLSIRHDVDTFVRPTLTRNALLQNLPLISNERCGSWYAQGLGVPYSTCYFKSTDGHVGTWNFSLKRLNLNVVEIVARNCQGCVVLDSSVRKELPDSFSRTIPLWAACINRITARYRRALGLPPLSKWDDSLCTPSWIVSKEEHDTMQKLVEIRVEELYQSRAIVDPSWLARTLQKPLRPYWITPQHAELPDQHNDNNDYYAIICLNCSTHHPHRVWNEEENFWYTPGAADDHELWGRHLTPRQFWNNIHVLLNEAHTDEATEQAIDAIVGAQQDNDTTTMNGACTYFDWIGTTGLAIGTRRVGRPPECWQHFDAVLNVTDMEYPDINFPESKFYLQLPIKEGKRDKTELERWMAVGIVYCVVHVKHHRRILIHCAQGKDRSVAIAMSTVVLFCNLTCPLQWNDTLWSISLEDLMLDKTNVADETSATTLEGESSLFQSSGLPTRLVDGLLGRAGRDCLLNWVRDCKNLADNAPLATKETLRIVLHLIRQDREQAEPTRSTMQKLNRFFMSGNYEKLATSRVMSR